MKDELTALAVLLSQNYTLADGLSNAPLLLTQLSQDETRIISAYQHFSGVSHTDSPLSYSAEWLLDNFFVVQQAIRQIREDLPVGYYRQLPRLSNPEYANLPRAYALASELMKHSNCQLDAQQIVRFLEAFQASVPLTMGELWAFPIMLRLTIINRLADALTASIKEASPVNGADNEMIRFCIISLRGLATQDWKVFFEQVSLIEALLLRDPAQIYSTMDFATRNSYRMAVEQIARLTQQTETAVTEQTIALSQAAPQRSRAAHVGYYLVGDGKQLLEDRLGYHPALHIRFGRWLLAHPTRFYLTSMGLVTALVMLALYSYAESRNASSLQLFWIVTLSFLPATAVASSLVNAWITSTLSPRLLPRLDLKDGIPLDYRTMVVIPALLTDTAEIDSLLQQIELHFLRNASPALTFALLTDYADAPSEHLPTDEALIEYAKAGILALNTKHQSGAPAFYLLHRERRWNPVQKAWMGWERKRGKLVEFNRLLRGDQNTSYTVQIGELSILTDVKYVITLDADTILPEGSARRLIEILAHPLNHAVYDSQTGKVSAGYSILQPRVEIKPLSANRTRFSQIFAGDVGLDLYTHAVSDVYQDLFGEGNYVGKGIYVVDVLEASLANRIPENTLLSHDLFEGIHARVALVTDVMLLEEYPAKYISYTRRLHRWIRGDWQLLPWLMSRIPVGETGQTAPNTFSPLDRWKMLDNLRRSLVAPALMLLLAVAWLGWIGTPLFWTLTVVAVLGVPLLLSLFNGFRYKPPTQTIGEVFRSRRSDALRWVFAVVFLPYENLVTLHAIITTLVRIFVTRREMLQWTTASQTDQMARMESGSQSVWREMRLVPILVALFVVVLLIFNPVGLIVALPLLTVWAVSPQIAYWLSQPRVITEAPLSVDQQVALRHLARQTWLFFEHTVGPEDHWLPPDHMQEKPSLTAHRTSPTNIGLLLTSTLAAYDLGYMGHLDLTTRLQATFETLDQLEHYRGHLLNWYDTRTIAPLAPRYVSTVDSGNLAGCLMVVQQACLNLPNVLIIRPERWVGLLDTLGLLEKVLEGVYAARLDEPVVALRTYMTSLREYIEAEHQYPQGWATLITSLSGPAWDKLSSLIVAVFEQDSPLVDDKFLSDVRITSERVRHHLAGMKRDIDLLLPWLLPLSSPPALFRADVPVAELWQMLQAVFPSTPRLRDVSRICETALVAVSQIQTHISVNTYPADAVAEAVAWCASLSARLEITALQADALLGSYQTLAEQSEAHFQAMDFGFLFNKQRNIFHIGYNVTGDTLDDNYYDLLASESRLASLLAIAKREVPPNHWLYLGRPVTQVKDTLALLSWSGTMFEYLMPALFMKHYEQTFITQSCRAAVDDQIAYGKSKNVPWGISESAFYAFDGTMTYQYHAFGVPRLGLKRTSEEDLVITPYASLLALGVRPQAVRQNMDALDALNMRGLYGFYEAIDYTPSRMPLRTEHKVIQSYMAHHQGMILMSLANTLLDDVMIERFHADRRIQSFALLLQEKIPTQAPIELAQPEEITAYNAPASTVNIAPWRIPNDATLPQVHTLSNERYSTVITHNGGGYSQWQGVSLTRWKADTTLDAWGVWAYVQDLDSGRLWSAAVQPTATPRDYQHVAFYPHQVEFQRRDHDITVNMQVTVAADDDIEIRKITFINHSDRPRRLRVTSYGEVLLAPQAERHPAFNKLFVESEYVPNSNLLLFHRRPRSGDEEPVYLGHFLITGEGVPVTGAYEGDRARFLGRGQTVRAPDVFTAPGQDLSQTVGMTLDPIMALGQDIKLEPYGRTSMAYLTLMAPSRAFAIHLAQRYQDWGVMERAIELSRRRNELTLNQLEMETAELARIQHVLSRLLFPHAGLRAAPDVLNANMLGQSGLWQYGISGDLPILLVRVGDINELAIISELLRAHLYWRDQHVNVDLVILNQRDSSYSQELQGQLYRLIMRMNSTPHLNQRGGIFILNADQMSPADRTLLETVARVVLDGQRGTLGEQLPPITVQTVALPPLKASVSMMDDPEPTPVLPRPTDLQFDNGWGGFSPDGKTYVMYLPAGEWTPAPWINVIANPEFGFLVSEAGAGYTWAGNSGENRLTPWNNDPVGDRAGEALYLRDEETAEVWSPTPYPSRDDQPYIARHGAGYSEFEHHSNGLKQRTQLFAALDSPVKIIRLRLENTWSRPRRITVTYYAEWVLGVSRTASQTFITPEYDHKTGALLARNPYNAEFGGRVAFLAANKRPHALTTDRAEFIGKLGDMARPAALRRIGLESKIEAALDPCAALQLHVDLPVGASEEVFFLLGQGVIREDAIDLIETYQKAERVESAWGEVADFWDKTLGTVTVQTPDPAMNLMLNRWLLYQALACRIWGRSAFYQSSGAFGFRDQLQDVMALMWATPNVARDHILLAARHQFETGDVLHWWHPPSGRGVKTRFSDDLLWLPFVVAHYIEATGDTAILDEQIPFLQSEPLKANEDERYGLYATTAETTSLYDHCLRAIQRGATSGVHGLPLMGTGDWNDGMNRVGVGGRGESIWLGWFLHHILMRFAPICVSHDDADQAETYQHQADKLKTALETNGWDGQWYRRAYDDHGMPLGSEQNLECKIDSIAQSWAVLSGAGDAHRSVQAMSAVLNRLVKRDEGLILLFTPPFNKTTRDPGYIKGYPPGIRENGGQYTHAAIWTVWAFAQLGQGDLAGELFQLLNPISHADTPEKAASYRVEPYVIAADVYGVEPHMGRGGWTWYTGSASWMYRLGVEALLGFKREGNRLLIDPCIPCDWESYDLTYRDGETVYHLHIRNPEKLNRGVVQVTMDGHILSDGTIDLISDGLQHEIEIRLGAMG
ncbi:MAG: cellobiose phosphorylase [Anaerolineae bacterium]|nr:cellobiose phosphorylase [Anaerolineae bacterium]